MIVTSDSFARTARAMDPVIKPSPINQIVGYILSEDPTYITNYKNARGMIRKIDRDELLNILVRSYLDKE